MAKLVPNMMMFMVLDPRTIALAKNPEAFRSLMRLVQRTCMFEGLNVISMDRQLQQLFAGLQYNVWWVPYTQRKIEFWTSF